MSSTASDLIKFEKQGSGENSGTWGTLANKAMSRIEEAIAGYRAITLAGGTYTLDDTQYVENSTTTAESHLAIIKATGTPGASRKIQVPLRTKHYLIWNAVTTYDLTVGGSSGGTITVPNGFMQHVFCDGTNVEACSPAVSVDGAINLMGQTMFDSNGNEMLKFTDTGSAVNELTLKNEAAGSNPGFTATGGDTNVGIDLIPKGTGVVRQGSTAVGLTGLQTIWVPAAAMRPTVSNGCADITDVETTAGRPDMQVLDFDTSADEHAQFQILFPKSWNEGTITFRVAWTTTATDTGTVAWGLQGVAVGDGDTIDVAYGTAVVVSDAGQSTAEDLYLTAESSAVTIAGSPAVDQLCYFRIFRDVSADAMEEDARLMGVRILWTTDAGNDA
jgi:hypothetical protein